MYMPKSAQLVQTTGQPASGFMPKSAVLVPKEKKTLGGFVQNIGESGVSMVGSTVGAVTHPVETVKNLINLVKDPNVLIEYYKNRYGKDLAQTLYEDPVGVLSDLSTVLGGAGALIKGVDAISDIGKISKVGQIADTASDISTLSKIDNKITNISRTIDPIAATTKAISTPVSKLFKKVGPKLTKTGESLVTKGLGNPAKQADITAKTGIKVSDFIDKYDLYDRSPETANAVKKAILSKYDDLATMSGSSIKVKDLIGTIDKQIKDLTSGTNTFSETNAKTAVELAKRRLQILDLSEGSDIIPTAKIVEYRRVLDKDIPMSEFGLNNKALGKRSGAKVTRDILKSQIDGTNPEIATLGKEYGVAKGVEDIFRKSQNRAGNRQLISLPKIGTAGVGGMVAGVPGAFLGLGAELITTSPKVLEASSKLLRSVGKNMTNANMPKVPGIVRPIYNVGRAGRLINQTMPSKKQEQQRLTKDVSFQSKLPVQPKILPSKVSQSSQIVAQPTSINPKLKIKNSPFKTKKVTKGSFY